MATVYGANKTKIRAGTIDNLCDKGTYDAEVRAIIDTYEAAALAGGSVIQMGGILPDSARVVEQLLCFDALGGDVVVQVGDSDTANRYMTDVDCSSAGFQRMENIGGVDYKEGTATGDNQVLITTTGGTAATGTIKLVTFYTV